MCQIVGVHLFLVFFFFFKPHLIIGKAKEPDPPACSVVEYIEDNVLNTSNLHAIRKLHKALFLDEKSTASISLVPKNVCMKTDQKQTCCDTNTLENIHNFLSEREIIVKGSVSGGVLGLLVDPNIGLVTLQRKRFDASKRNITGSNLATVYSKTNTFLGSLQAKIESLRREFQSISIAKAIQPIFSHVETTLCSACNPAISKVRVTSDTLKIKQDGNVLKKLKASYLSANKKYFTAYEKLIQEFLSPDGIIDKALLLRNEYYAALLFTFSSHLHNVKYANTTFLFDTIHSPISLLQSLYHDSLQQEAKQVKPHNINNTKSSDNSSSNEKNSTSIENSESIEESNVTENTNFVNGDSNLNTIFKHEDPLDKYSSDSKLFTQSNITYTKEKLTECLRYVRLIDTDMLIQKQSASFNNNFEKLFELSLNDLTMKRFMLNFLLAPQACLFDIVLNLVQYLPDPRIDNTLIERLTYFKKNPKEFGDDSSSLIKNFKVIVRMCERFNIQLRNEFFLKDQQFLISALENSAKDKSST